jgi:outer membrane biogenesis lipoprotein LolB
MALSGCAVQPKPVPPPESGAALSAPTLKTSFSATGRFSAKNATEQVSGQFRYTQTGTLRTLNLFSPLGTPIADIVANSESATLTQAGGATQTAASLSDLLRTVIDLPVTDAMLSAWLQGLPSVPTGYAGNIELDAARVPVRFVEADWEILVSARMDAGSGSPAAPRRMRWSLMGRPDTEVRWVIDEWSGR